eukprot:9018111-Pyramimonas_sp.AAC.1
MPRSRKDRAGTTCCSRNRARAGRPDGMATYTSGTRKRRSSKSATCAMYPWWQQEEIAAPYRRYTRILPKQSRDPRTLFFGYLGRKGRPLGPALVKC